VANAVVRKIPTVEEAERKILEIWDKMNAEEPRTPSPEPEVAV
jgi:hypothetical protein